MLFQRCAIPATCYFSDVLFQRRVQRHHQHQIMSFHVSPRCNMDFPGIRDVTGERTAFHPFHCNISLHHRNYTTVYARDCRRQHASIPLRADAARTVAECIQGDRSMLRRELEEYGGATSTHGDAWLEFRHLPDTHKLLCFVWDYTSKPQRGLSKTTYVTEHYWTAWQNTMHKM
jgi:hypothetical protein